MAPDLVTTLKWSYGNLFLIRLPYGTLVILVGINRNLFLATVTQAAIWSTCNISCQIVVATGKLATMTHNNTVYVQECCYSGSNAGFLKYTSSSYCQVESLESSAEFRVNKLG